jgi:predicted AAA+ superfamily ATPase
MFAGSNRADFLSAQQKLPKDLPIEDVLACDARSMTRIKQSANGQFIVVQPNQIRNSLIETSISRDIVMLTKIEKPALLRRLFELGSVSSAKLVSLTKIQGDLQEKGNITTLSNYLHLLSGAGLLTGLEKYAGSVIRRRASIPKFQVYNNALMSQMLNTTLEQAKANHKLWGQIVESAVGCHLLNHSITEKYNLYYWNENSNEVDFVIERNNEIVGLEIKTGKDSTNLGLSVFSEQFHPKHVFTIGTDGIDFETFFKMNPVSFFL